MFWTTAPPTSKGIARSFSTTTLSSFFPFSSSIMPRRHHAKRQGFVDIDAPTGLGITDGAKTVDESATISATGLLFDDSVSGGPTLAPTSIAPIITSTRPLTTPVSSNPPDSTGSPQTVNAAASPIAISTVVGACVGALIGAAAFILLAFFFYRRYSQSLKRKAHRRPSPRSMYDDGRNGRGDLDRRLSKRESWNQLKDTDEHDKWEGMAKAPVTRELKEMGNVSPGPYARPPSNPFASALDPPVNHTYGTTAPLAMPTPEPLALLGRGPAHTLGGIDAGPPLSWASDSNAPFIPAAHVADGNMSPPISMAIPTPPAVKSQLHRWESAEVVDFSEGQTAEIVDYSPPKQSSHNPFAPSISSDHTINHPSSHSRNSSASTIQPAKADSKERVVSIDPFRDPMPQPKFIHHVPTSSTSSAENNRAIRQLVAAASLDDLGEDEVQRRLRVASMQPSIISSSGDSMYTDAEPDPADIAMMRSFPAPPSSSGHTMHSHK